MVVEEAVLVTAEPRVVKRFFEIVRQTKSVMSCAEGNFVELILPTFRA